MFVMTMVMIIMIMILLVDGNVVCSDLGDKENDEDDDVDDISFCR